MPWFKGNTLFDSLDSLEIPKRPLDKPLRLPIQDVFKIGGIGTVPVECVIIVILRTGQVVTVTPAMITTECKSVEMHHEALTQAVPGDNAGLHLKGTSVKDIKREFVQGHSKQNSPHESESIQNQVIVMQYQIHILKQFS
ncbi:MAG: putative translation elongation factor-1 alpha [Streblomastix strix]|uniref:Putative translation elongation factor-1 alpha n=1 Tax=Streblomastix strix TaxID=222440 RepID=A0A5J4TFY9_9EUKA|nr:MAG: putative translation elongation factor-1 alpha [Streblomastix strix]